MTRVPIAHLKQSGVDLIIIPLDKTFGHKSRLQQNQVISELQMRSTAAGLRGTCVPVWDSGGGRMGFIAPQNWHPFFNSVNLTWVAANVNRELRF